MIIPRSAQAIPVRAFRLVLLLPLRLKQPQDKPVPINKHSQVASPPGYEAAVAAMEAASDQWKELDDLLHQSDDSCCPATDQDADNRYAEFVYFHPYIQKFLYRKDKDKTREREDWPLRVWQHKTVRRMRTFLPNGQNQPSASQPPFLMDFDVSRCQVKLFSTGNAVLTLELALRDVAAHSLAQVQDAIDFLRHTYPAYWAERIEGGRYPVSREWQDANGNAIAGIEETSLENRREAFRQAVHSDRQFPLDDHFAKLLAPLDGLYEQIEDERIPHLAFVAVDDASTVSEADQARLAFADYRGDHPTSFPYAPGFLTDFAKRHAYDRWWAPARGWSARYFNVGYGFTALGSGDFFVGQLQNDFRRMYVQLATLAHFNKAALLTFSNRLADGASISEQSEDYRRHTRAVLADLMSFTQRHWFSGVSNQVQASELYAMWQQQLDLKTLYEDVAREARESNEFLARKAEEQQANAVEKLTRMALYAAVIGLLLAAMGAGFPWDKPLSLLLDKADNICWWWTEKCTNGYSIPRLVWLTIWLPILTGAGVYLWRRFRREYL